MWRRLRLAVDGAGLSTSRWLENWQGADRQPEKFFLAVSPSNIPVIPVGSGHEPDWRKVHGLGGARWVLGYFGTIGAGKRFDWVVAAWRRMRTAEPATALVVIGGQPRLKITAEEAPWWKLLGQVEAKAVSEALQALDVLVVPFVDGVSERRSTFMAGLAHGLPVVTTIGPSTGRELRTGDFFLGLPSRDDDAFAAAVAEFVPRTPLRRAMAVRARAQYAEHYSWERLAEELTARLEAGLRDSGPWRGDG
jgi:glycosyltransferase involved in cell wall biosynthesis